MALSEFNKLILGLQKGQYAPVYLIDGEESYYMDIVTDYFEEKILQAHERDFNLTVIYGKDAEWVDIVNACRRFPMFAERQVVIIKDAAQMKDLSELNSYIEEPSPTTVLLIEHRNKKVDGRSKLPKIIANKGIHYTANKLKDTELPSWIQAYGDEHGLRIGHKESDLLAAYLGNDLKRIANEIEKVRINMEPGEVELSPQLIQKYIGISKEYNVFGYGDALTGGNKDQLYKMLNYFLANPKSAPVPLLVGTLYNHFERIYLQFHLHKKSASEIASLLKLKNEWTAKNYMNKPAFNLAQIEECLLTLADFSGRFVGIHSSISDIEWLKEFTARIELILSGQLQLA